MKTIAVMLDDTGRPAKLFEVVYISGGSAYVRPFDEPDAPLCEVCIDELWCLT